MKKDRFWGFLGRANAVIMFFAGLLILGFMGYGISEIWKESRYSQVCHPPWDYRQPKFGDPAEDPLLPQGRFKRTGDYTWVFAEYEVERKETGTKKGGIYEEGVNYLFLNTETGETRWLRSDNSGSVHYLEYAEYFGFEWDEVEVPFLLYRARERDTDGNGVVDRNDLNGLAISARDGSDYRILLDDLGYLHFMKRNTAGNTTILHQRADELWLVEIDPVTRTLLRHAKVEVVAVGNTGE